jgi:hypothetical protein
MPPRFAYWTIVAGGLPTAFRAAERDELLPTFKRIQEKHADAEMKYFARGRLWESPEQARQEAEARRAAFRRPEPRGRDWRPGGEHHDPRQKFKDAKKERNLDWRKTRFERRQRRDDAAGRPDSARPPVPIAGRPSHEKPPGDRLRPPAPKPAGRNQGRPDRDRFIRDREQAARPERFRPQGRPGDRKPVARPGDRKPVGPPRDRQHPGPGGHKPGGPSASRKAGGPPRGSRPGPGRDRTPRNRPADRRRR